MKASRPAGRGGGRFKSESVYWCPFKGAFLDCYLIRPANVDAWRRRRLVQPGCWKASSSAPTHPAPSFDGAVSEERARRWCGAGRSNDRINQQTHCRVFLRPAPQSRHEVHSLICGVRTRREARKSWVQNPENIIRDAFSGEVLEGVDFEKGQHWYTWTSSEDKCEIKVFSKIFSWIYNHFQSDKSDTNTSPAFAFQIVKWMQWYLHRLKNSCCRAVAYSSEFIKVQFVQIEYPEPTEHLLLHISFRLFEDFNLF